jgi:hypothetical protein
VILLDKNESLKKYIYGRPAGTVKYYKGNGSGSENKIDQFIKNREEL